MIDFEEYFNPYIKNFIEVDIPEDKVKKIKLLAIKIANYKSREPHHIRDGGQEIKRWTTGLIGESAIEELLGVEIIDWTTGDSRLYNIPDMDKSNIKVGIKTVEIGKFPVIFKKNIYPQIINVKLSDNKVLVCGYASTINLNEYQSDDLILSDNLRKRDVKTGYFGFDKLIKFSNIEELKNVYNATEVN